jgi:hypothetical protein
MKFKGTIVAPVEQAIETEVNSKEEDLEKLKDDSMSYQSEKKFILNSDDEYFRVFNKILLSMLQTRCYKKTAIIKEQESSSLIRMRKRKKKLNKIHPKY